MHIDFSSIRARTAVDRWVAQYGGGKHVDTGKGSITEKLVSLPLGDRTATAIAQIIGNKSWTHPSCAECREYVDVAISLGEDPSVTVCLPCMRGAVAAVQAAAMILAPIGGGIPQ